MTILLSLVFIYMKKLKLSVFFKKRFLDFQIAIEIRLISLYLTI